MPRRGLDDYGAIAEHIMILAVEQNRFAVGKTVEILWSGTRLPSGRGADRGVLSRAEQMINPESRHLDYERTAQGATE